MSSETTAPIAAQNFRVRVQTSNFRVADRVLCLGIILIRERRGVYVVRRRFKIDLRRRVELAAGSQSESFLVALKPTVGSIGGGPHFRDERALEVIVREARDLGERRLEQRNVLPVHREILYGIRGAISNVIRAYVVGSTDGDCEPICR